MSYKRKYRPGDRILSLDDLVQQDQVYAFGTESRGIRHISVLQSMPLRTVQKFLERGIYKATPTEDPPDEESIPIQHVGYTPEQMGYDK